MDPSKTLWPEALRDLTSGTQVDLAELAAGATMDGQGSDLVAVRDVPFISLCEHHLLPFIGSVHIGYVPGKKLLKAGAAQRIIDAFARRLQLQERLTEDLAAFLERVLEPQGLGVVCEAQHTCTQLKRTAHPTTLVTSALRGVVQTDEAHRAAFLALTGPR